MSDLVGNPEDRFSRVAANLIQEESLPVGGDQLSHGEKTGLLGSRTRPTQTGLYSL